MNTITRLTMTALLALSATMATAADFDAATYHENNCTRCHGSGVYTREDRRVQDLAALEAQVARCDAMLETQLFPSDLAQLVDHLNDEYYQFGQ